MQPFTSLPPVIRSRNALLFKREVAPAISLPITQNGTTYNLAQVARWIDADHFAVGRFDGTMSIFRFETDQYVGPSIKKAVNTPSSVGVQMITLLPNSTIVTSNDTSSLCLWVSDSAEWSDLKLKTTVPYDSTLDVATSGAWFPASVSGGCSTLVVGHASGFITIWSVSLPGDEIILIDTIDLRNPNPVNPFGSHVMYGMCPLVESGTDASVVCGSDDGYVSIVKVPSGTILSQTLFNPSAQRGINSVSAFGNKLLVANCAVGSDDKNLWYFDVDLSTGAITLLDSLNLILDTNRVQSFNFDTIWGAYTDGPCWFAGTEEGLLWMGTADTELHLIGQESLFDGAIGAALAFTDGPGRLAAVIHDLDQFTTGSP